MTGSLTPSKQFDARKLRVAVVAARFNEALVEQLLDGATHAWREHGGNPDELIIERVPGAFELPLASQALAGSGKVHAVVALGCVIRGDTPHFDYVAGECARGLMDAGLATGVPVIFGVLTTENQAQAEARASVTRMNKGRESMLAALEMIELLGRNGKTATRARQSAKRSAKRSGKRK